MSSRLGSMKMAIAWRENTRGQRGRPRWPPRPDLVPPGAVTAPPAGSVASPPAAALPAAAAATTPGPELLLRCPWNKRTTRTVSRGTSLPRWVRGLSRAAGIRPLKGYCQLFEAALLASTELRRSNWRWASLIRARQDFLSEP